MQKQTREIHGVIYTPPYTKESCTIRKPAKHYSRLKFYSKAEYCLMLILMSMTLYMASTLTMRALPLFTPIPEKMAEALAFLILVIGGFWMNSWKMPVRKKKTAKKEARP